MCSVQSPADSYIGMGKTINHQACIYTTMHIATHYILPTGHFSNLDDQLWLVHWR